MTSMLTLTLTSKSTLSPTDFHALPWPPLDLSFPPIPPPRSRTSDIRSLHGLLIDLRSCSAQHSTLSSPQAFPSNSTLWSFSSFSFCSGHFSSPHKPSLCCLCTAHPCSLLNPPYPAVCPDAICPPGPTSKDGLSRSRQIPYFP